MWRRLEKPRTVLATRPLVKEFFAMTAAPHDRPLRKRRLEAYRAILDRGEFRPVTWASAVCKADGTTYRVNGKHTSHLLTECDELPEFYVTVERYECDELSDVASLYATFDSNLGVRTAGDLNMAFAATVPALAGTPERFISMTVAAAAFHQWGTEAVRVPAAERAELILDRVPFVLWLREVIPGSAIGGNTAGGGAQAKPLCRTAVVTAMMATFDRNATAAGEFWAMVRDESHPHRDDPTRVLAKFLTVASIRSATSSGRSAKQLVGVREMYVKSLHAWNAWRAGTRTTLRFYPEAADPEVRK